MVGDLELGHEHQRAFGDDGACNWVQSEGGAEAAVLYTNLEVVYVWLSLDVIQHAVHTSEVFVRFSRGVSDVDGNEHRAWVPRRE